MTVLHLQPADDDKRYKVEAEDWDGMAVDDMWGAWSGAAHIPYLNCTARYCREIKTKDSEAAVNTALPTALSWDVHGFHRWRECGRALTIPVLVGALWTGKRQASCCDTHERMTAK